MSTSNFSALRDKWIESVSRVLAKGETVRQQLREELGKFFDLMVQSVETGDPKWLNPVLDEWIEARTQTEVEKLESSLTPLLKQIMTATYELVANMFTPDVSLQIIGAILPIFTHAFEYVTTAETNLYLQNFSDKIKRAQMELERLDKSKSDFISVAAHELKTPLTLIEGYSAMLKEQMKSETENENTALLLKGIENGTKRLREIIDDMIDVSMIDNNLLSLNFQPVWIRQILTLVVEEMNDAAINRNINLIMNKFEGSDEMTFGDPNRLYQAFRNIIQNAIKFTPDGGTISIDGRLLPGFVEVTITDTGIGIAPEDHERIFEKFGRIGSVEHHSSGKVKFKGGGPGLGLPITKGIIEAHGGAIWVESEGYDEVRCPGSTFHVLLPIQKTPPDEKIAKLFEPLAQPSTEDMSDRKHA